MQHRMGLMAFAFNWKVSSSWNAKKGELWSWIRNIKLEFQTCSKMFSKSDRKDGNWSRCCQRLRTLALCWHRTKHTGCLKKTEFYRNEHLQIFFTNIISISSQLAPGSPNAQFGKTHFFWDTLYIVTARKSLRLLQKRQPCSCLNLKIELF